MIKYPLKFRTKTHSTMHLKILFASLAICSLLTTTALAQALPSYVPTNGLVGWWPLDNSAIDASSNGDDGVLYRAVPEIDRYGISNTAKAFCAKISKSIAMRSKSQRLHSMALWLTGLAQNEDSPRSLYSCCHARDMKKFQNKNKLYSHCYVAHDWWRVGDRPFLLVSEPHLKAIQA
jgi:hypothetical protein